MVNYNEETKRYSKEEIMQYLNIVGYDLEDLKKTKVRECKSLKLEYLSDLYNLIGADKELPISSSLISMKYEILMEQINEDFIYTEEESKRLMKDALEILKDVSLLQVCDDEKDPLTIFERTNSILNIALDGLITCDNISQLKMIFDNCSPQLLEIKGELAKDEQLIKLYGLKALSKFNHVESDSDIFNEFDSIDEKQLYEKLNYLITKSETFTMQKGKDELNKQLLFRRPTLKELEVEGDYKRM